MGSPLDSAQFVKLLDTRHREVAENKFKELPSMIDKMYRRLDSDRAWEAFYEIGSVPDIPEFNGKISYLPIYPGYETVIEPKEFAGGIQAERKLIDDKKYPVLDKRSEGLARSARRTQEKYAVEPFAYATSTAYTFMTVHEEAVALASSSHTTKSGTSTTTGFDNTGTDALSKTSVSAARIAMRGFRNDISERIDVSDNMGLVLPDNLADTGFEIVDTPKSLDMIEGNVNRHYKRYEVIPWLRLDDYDTNNWGLVDMDQMKEDLIWIDRIAAEFKNTVDFETYMLKQAVYFRIANGFKDWRWLYWNVVS